MLAYVGSQKFAVQLQVPHKFCCAPPCPCCQKFGVKHVLTPALWRRRLCPMNIPTKFKLIWLSVTQLVFLQKKVTWLCDLYRRPFDLGDSFIVWPTSLEICESYGRIELWRHQSHVPRALTFEWLWIRNNHIFGILRIR